MEEDTGVPVQHQVMAYDVRFPILRAIFLKSSPLREEMDTLSYTDLWGQLGAVQRAASKHRASLQEIKPGQWSLVVFLGDASLMTVSLTQALAET